MHVIDHAQTLVVVAVMVWWICARGSRNRIRNEVSRAGPVSFCFMPRSGACRRSLPFHCHTDQPKMFHVLQRGERLPEDKFDRVERRAEDSFSLPQKKGAYPPSPTSPSNFHSRSAAPVVNVPLRSSNESRSSSSGEWGRQSKESKYSSESDYIGPTDLGYATTSSGSKESSEEDLEPLPSLRAARKSRRRSFKQSRRDPPPPPPLALNAGAPGDVRRYAPAKPSPLAQASYRDSILSASSAPSPLPTPTPPTPAYIAPTANHVRSPISPSFGDAEDPFFGEPEEYYHEDAGGRPLSGVGYAI